MMAFKPYKPLVSHEYSCEICGEKFKSYLSPEQYARLGGPLLCLLCSFGASE